jgi:hypothetical protein
LAICLLTSLPYLYAYAVEPPGRVFQGFFFLQDDAYTYLAKMREGWEGTWLWTNRYSTEPGAGAYFFTFWLALGHLAAIAHLSLMQMYQVARVVGGFALVMAAWTYIGHFLPERARRFAIFLLALDLGWGFVLSGRPVILGSQTDSLDLKMPELSAFFSILSLPHFVWAAAFQALAIVVTLRAVQAGSIGSAVVAGLLWLAEASIHAQMPVLIGGALLVALLWRRPALWGWVAFLIAFAIPGPYVLYSFWASMHNPDVLRWASEWRNNLPPDGISLVVALLPQLLLAALALPGMLRRRSREDIFLLAWLILLATILWLPTPAANLRRRFFDGIYLVFTVMAARGMVDVLLPRLRSIRLRRLLPFTWVALAAVDSAFLTLAPMLIARSAPYTVPAGVTAGIAWLNEQPVGVVVSTPGVGLMVPAGSSDTVYVGQYSETFRASQKAVDADQLLRGQVDPATFDRMHRVEVRYIFWTTDLGPLPIDATAPAFTAIGVRIYRLY